MTTHDERVRFFYDHAGWGYDPTKETSEQGRARGAERLARAEELASSHGWYVTTFYDYDNSGDPDDDGETARMLERGELVRLGVVLSDGDGAILASLGSVIVPNEDDPYVRVVGAELASEMIASHEHCGGTAWKNARVTCNGCRHAWCEVCDPAPMSLCHWCHGRGESTAEMPAPTYEEMGR